MFSIFLYVVVRHDTCSGTISYILLYFIALQVSFGQDNLKNNIRIIFLSCPYVLLESVLDCWQALLFVSVVL